MRVLGSKCGSEVELQGELNVPRGIKAAHGTHYAKVAVVDTRIWRAELWMVEGVEYLYAEFEVVLVLRSEVVVLEERDVPIVDAGVVHAVERARRIAECERSWL